MENTCTHNPVLNSTRVAGQTMSVHSALTTFLPPTTKGPLVTITFGHATLELDMSFVLHKASTWRRGYHFQPQLREIRVGQFPAARHQVGMALAMYI